jgi:hypothetical protein
LVGMGPSAHHVGPDELRLRLQDAALGLRGAFSGSGSERLSVTLSVTLKEYAPLRD